MVRIRPFLTLQGVYTDGLTPVSLEGPDRISDVETVGATATFGAYGYHQWQRSVLGLAYQGRARHYSKRRFDGIDQTIGLQFTHQPSRRVLFSLNQAAGYYTQGLGLGAMSPLAGSGFNFTPNIGGQGPLGIPEDEIFDTRTHYFSSSGDIAYNFSSRLSASAGGTGFFVRRRAAGLAGVDGFAARADLAYRLSRQQTISVQYGFFRYEFTRAFGSADVHLTALNYSRILSRRWTASLRAGAARFERLGTTRVRLDPAVAALLGQTTGTEVFYGTGYGSILGAHLNGNFRHSSVNFGYNRYLTPGNGVFLLSQVDNVMAGYSYTGIRRWSLGVRAAYFRYTARDQTARNLESYNASASVSRGIFSWMHFVSSATLRRSETGRFKRDSYMISIGLGFTPGELPLAFW